MHIEDIPPKEIIPGFFARMIHGKSSTVAYWDIKKGSVMPEHHHIHEQTTYISEGRLLMTIAGKEYDLSAGDSHVILSNEPHSAVAITDCRVIDFFTPVREDYR